MVAVLFIPMNRQGWKKNRDYQERFQLPLRTDPSAWGLHRNLQKLQRASQSRWKKTIHPVEAGEGNPKFSA